MKLLLLSAAAVGSIAATLGLGVPTAQAIDCSKAATAVEKMICADPVAAKADNDMAAAYSALAKHLFAPQKKLLAGNQSAWIAERESCTETADTTAAAQAACVIDLTTQRRAFLAGLPAEGPGTTSPLQPVIKHGADDTYLTSLEFPHPSTPAEKLLNAELARDFAKAHAAASEEDDYSDNFNATLKYASAELLSVNIEGADLSPKLPHPMPFNYNLNIDVKAGKKLTMAAALDQPGLAKMQDECLGQLKDYMADPDLTTGDIDPQLIKADMANLDAWSFGAGQATLVFDPGDDPPAGVCHLPYSDLRPLLKPGFPLPQ